MQFKTDFFMLYGVDAANHLKVYLYNYNFEPTQTVDTGIKVD